MDPIQIPTGKPVDLMLGNGARVTLTFHEDGRVEMAAGEHKGRAKALEETLKRLLAAMQMGVYVYSGDGHRWIHVDEEREEYPFPHEHLERCKVYGGIHEALSALDEALKEAGRESFLDFYKANCDWLGFFD